MANEALYHEEVELSEDSQDDEKYGAVSDGDSSSDEDLTQMMQNMKTNPSAVKDSWLIKSCMTEAAENVSDTKSLKKEETTKKHVVVDDFIRNFLHKLGMRNTLDAFETEWYQLKQQGKVRENDNVNVPDEYVKNSDMDGQVRDLRTQLAAVKEIADKAKATWGKFRKQRDYYRMHHRRVVQEKDKLILDIKRLKKEIAQFEPALNMMKKKYEGAINTASLTRIAKERSEARIAKLEKKIAKFEGKDDKDSKASPGDRKSKSVRRKNEDSIIPADDRPNPYLNRTFDIPNVQDFMLAKTFRGHKQAISGIAIHPKKPVIATASDDKTWKLWSIPKGELILSGSGHKAWISGVDFHPKGAHLATTSGDGTVKVWDFLKTKCSVTFTEHTQAVWDCAFHDSGDFLATCSMDQTLKLWDMNSQRCRHTFRGHVDSINSVVFQPFSNNLCTGSADKSVSMWDLRSGLCIQTFVGHKNAVGTVCFGLRGDSILSTDMDGFARVWDVRMVSERLSVDFKVPINDAKFDRGSGVIIAACDDATVKVADAEEGRIIGVLQGHEKAVQTVQMDHSDRFLISCGSDSTFRVWA
ncbi:hypothetical protein AAMO2058_000260800 [Amorphochlora amoebiformis]